MDVRNVKARRGRTRIEVWFDAWIAALSFVTFIVLLGAAIYSALGLRKGQSRQPITILVVGQEGVSATNVAQVFFTNVGDLGYDCVVTSEIFRNGEWREATVQHSEAVFVMRPRSHSPWLMPIPQEGRAWRVK